MEAIPEVTAEVGRFLARYARNGKGGYPTSMERYAIGKANEAAKVAPDLLAELKRLARAYVALLETGRDRIVSLGGSCDPVDVMEAGDPSLISARAAIAKATGAGQ